MADEKYYAENQGEEENFAPEDEEFDETAAEMTEEEEQGDELKSDLETLLGFLTDTIQRGKTIPLQAGKKLVNVQMCMDIISDIRDNLPEEVRWAYGIISDRDRLMNEAKAVAETRVKAADARADASIADAQKRAQDIVSEAEAHAAEIVEQAQKRARAMIDQSEITRLAHEEANQICEDARADANDQRLKATRYAESLLGELERDVQATLDAVRRSIDNISGSAQ